jgi:hypothetical protein
MIPLISTKFKFAEYRVLDITLNGKYHPATKGTRVTIQDADPAIVILLDNVSKRFYTDERDPNKLEKLLEGVVKCLIQS